MRQLIMATVLSGLVAFGYGQGASVVPTPAPAVQGKASFYGGYKITANGERFRSDSMTAAHKTLPFGSMVRVENVATGRSTTVRINNRGPYIAGRDLDLTTGAFRKIASLDQGVVPVRYTVLSIGDNKYWRADKRKWFPLGNNSAE